MMIDDDEAAIELFGNYKRQVRRNRAAFSQIEKLRKRRRHNSCGGRVKDQPARRNCRQRPGALINAMLRVAVKLQPVRPVTLDHKPLRPRSLKLCEEIAERDCMGWMNQCHSFSIASHQHPQTSRLNASAESHTSPVCPGSRRTQCSHHSTSLKLLHFRAP